LFREIRGGGVMEVGDRVRIKNDDYLGMIGTVEDIYEELILVSFEDGTDDLFFNEEVVKEEVKV
jgi:hypothetical protein